MDDIIARIWQNLGDRITGPMSFRLLLQPSVAAFFAIRAGLQDARLGRPPYTWTVFTTDAATRRVLLREGWKAIAKVFCLAIVLDCVYQVIVLRWIYPGEALMVALMLAGVPYLLIRGPVDRLIRARRTPARANTR
jgi:hypothetical protein